MSLTSKYVFAAPDPVSVPVLGQAARFPVHRIYCVGRNYAEHAREMGAEIEKGRPVFFMKPADAVVSDGADVAWPGATGNLHHEVELVIALGAAGRPQNTDAALAMIYGYAVGNDLTRRDLQHECKSKGLPWDIAKGFDQSAPLSAIRPWAAGQPHPTTGAITLAVNGQIRQQADLAELIWSLPEILIELGKLYALKPGDLIYTGTPAGVGPLHVGDQVDAAIAGVGELHHRMV